VAGRLTIGVLALQGNFNQHIQMLNALSVKSIKIKYGYQLDSCGALIIPGGESTAISKLIFKARMHETISEFSKTRPVFGVCAGMILLSSNTDTNNLKTLKIMNYKVKRNAFGSQINSFSDKIKIKNFDNKFKAVFIRAPKVYKASSKIEILSIYNDEPVMIRENNHICTTFHPELTNDLRIHKYFIDIANE
tara:strand:- start:866 stop:1441 length:576 start_codon:yes stop_codon:yes gene_type:complete